MDLRFNFPVMIVFVIAGAVLPAQQTAPGDRNSIFTSQTINGIHPGNYTVDGLGAELRG
jgi:hypothetical protein